MPHHTPPHLQALAGESLVFEQAHVQSQMCVPTRNSFMTGRRPERTTVFNDGIGATADGFRAAPGGAGWTTLPGYFKRHGYFVTGVGKSFHPNQPKNFDQPMSWSEELPYYYPKPVACPTADDVWCAVPDDDPSGFEDSLVLAEAKARLDYAVNGSTGSPARPFFLAVGFHKPHTPYRAPQSFYDAQPPLAQTAVAAHPGFPANTTGLAWFSCQAEGKQYPINYTHNYPTLVQQQLRRAYYAAVSFTDANIGALLAHLDGLVASKRLAREDVLVVFHADHGYVPQLTASDVSFFYSLSTPACTTLLPLTSLLVVCPSPGTSWASATCTARRRTSTWRRTCRSWCARPSARTPAPWGSARRASRRSWT